MALTPKEAAYANTLLARGERQWRNWAVVRWLVLLVALVLLGSGAQAIRLGQTPPEESVAARGPKPETLARGDLTALRNELIGFAMTSSLLTSLGMGLIATALALGGFGLTHWNTHLRDGLLCRAIREKFHDELEHAAAAA